MRVRRLARFVVLLAAAGGISPVKAQAQARPVGCYRLVRSALRRAAASAQDSAYAAALGDLPPRFELTRRPLPAGWGRGWFRVRPDTLWPDPRGMAMPARWAPAGRGGGSGGGRGRDSLTVLWSSGFHGLELSLHLRGDTLTGRARPFSDAHVRGAPPPPEADVIAVRVPCAATR